MPSVSNMTIMSAHVLTRTIGLKRENSSMMLRCNGYYTGLHVWV